MDKTKIKKMLSSVKSGSMTVEKALDLLKHLPYEDIGCANVDHHRSLRQGIPEVLYAKDKNIEDIKAIAESMLKAHKRLLATKASKEVFKAISSISRRYRGKAVYYERSGVISVSDERVKIGLAAVLCAGTSDLPIAEEAMATLSFLGSKAELVSDIGVAGLHRIKKAEKLLSNAAVLIVVAGMEGALPSVIGGMTDKPIIAVPTSVGYGTSLGGITALFAMLNACVPGIAVMNIDNGFGAAVLAHKINKLKIESC